MKRHIIPFVLLLSAFAFLSLLVLTPSCSKYKSNGERIYMTGDSASGQAIIPGQFSQPMFTFTCANCHLPNGRGGEVTIMMSRYKVPNITWPVLTAPAPGRPAYTEATLKTAITRGKEPDGGTLEYPMPTWQMSNRDLNDLIAFLKTLK